MATARPARRIYHCATRTPTLDELRELAEWIDSGGLVAFPTETFYGLAADPRSDHAVQSLFDLKGRSRDSAVPLIAGSFELVVQLCGTIGEDSTRLAQRFWPGPLSLILDAPSWISSVVHGGTGTIAVRVPANELARDLAAAAGGILTATSANRSGEPPATHGAALQGLQPDPRLVIVDGGSTPGGAPSTIVDARQAEWRLIREGVVPWSHVLESK
ncbi:MAG: L-threonylcarbamoyladenylate synthase [Vicinamibacterales bacterium]